MTFTNVPNRFVTRWRPRMLAIVLAVTALLVGVATAAEAHDVLVGTSPTDGSIVAVAPAQVRLTFSQPALAVGTVVIVTGPAGRVQTGTAVLSGKAISQRLPPGSPAGRYTVAWRATSADGHPVSGTFSFTATSPSAVQRAPATTSGMPGTTSTPGTTGTTSTPGTTTTVTPSTHPNQSGDEAMSNLMFGDTPMAGMMPMSQGLLPPWVTWLWLAALSAVLVFHCAHFVRMAGQHRWYHSSHILMLVSMLYMYASMEFKWTWLSHSLQAVIFAMSSAAIAAWMIYRFVQRRPFSALWVLALIMQASMIYMWLPNWAPALTWTLVVYFGLETAAWLAGVLDDTKPAMAVGPSKQGLGGTLPGGSMPERGSMSFGRGDRPVDVPLAQSTMTSRVSMAVMAASMAYMFAAMQLMR